MRISSSRLLAMSAAIFFSSFFSTLTPVAASAQTPQAVTSAFTDSDASGLAATKRVAIASVVVSFQASAAGGQQQGNGLLADKNSAQTVLAMPVMDQGLQDAIAEEAYTQLKSMLSAAGFEVVPEAEVTSNASYKQILSVAGLPNHTKFGNAIGDAMLVGPNGLPPYIPYLMEASIFEMPKSYIGWVSAMGGKSITPGGPSSTSIQGTWKLPGLEVQMAKSLNAHVVKAFYVVTLGQASAERQRDRIATVGSPGFESAQGNARAQVGLLADQTRIAFRTPNGNNKWQKVAVNKPLPAKDGDVVVRLASPLTGSSDVFAMSSSSRLGGLLTQGADFQFSYTAALTDPARYKAEVQTMIANASQSMATLVHR